MKKINWKILFKFISLNCFIYQSIEMTTDYLKYKIIVEVKSRDYVVNRNITSFPGVSICKENILQNNDSGIDLKSYWV